VLIVEPGESGTIKIDAIREAVDHAGYRPFEGQRRVVIIDGADAMVGPAQDALLKTLEEPPPASVFVLVTCRSDVLAPTVRSRCQRLLFGRISAAGIAEVLERDHGYNSEDAHAAASLSDGSIGRALDTQAGDVVEARSAAMEMLRRVASAADVRPRLDGAKVLLGSGEGDELGRRLLAVASMVRDLGVLLSRADERGLANADLKPALSGLLGSFDRDRAVRAFSAVDRALVALDRNANPKLVADWVALQI
jgi:DNA polymerase III subunit delta'